MVGSRVIIKISFYSDHQKSNAPNTLDCGDFKTFHCYNSIFVLVSCSFISLYPALMCI